LSRLGRDLKKTLIVDNVEANFKLQPDNGIHIKNFEGEEEDEELFYLKRELLQLVDKSPDDIRDYISKIRLRMNCRIQNTQI
jgi:TFIIF-interacting CTD phosphatase-like protein